MSQPVARAVSAKLDLCRGLQLLSGDLSVLLDVDGIPKFEVPMKIAKEFALKKRDAKAPEPFLFFKKPSNQRPRRWPIYVSILTVIVSLALLATFFVGTDMSCEVCIREAEE